MDTNETHLTVRTRRPDGLAMGWLGLGWTDLEVYRSGVQLPAQWVPDAAGSGGMLLVACGAAGVHELVLRAVPAPPVQPAPGRVEAGVSAVHDASQGGLPRWNDLSLTWDDGVRERVRGAIEYPPGMGETQYCLRHDRQARVEQVSQGELAVVMRTTARYFNAQGAPAPGEPRAVYDWWYFRGLPLVWVHLRAFLAEDRWRALRFGAPRAAGLDRWCGGPPAEEGACADLQPVAFDGWALLHDGARALGVLCGSAQVERDATVGQGGLVADYALARLRDGIPAQAGVEEASAFFWAGPLDRQAVAALAQPGALPLDAVLRREEAPGKVMAEGGGVSLGLAVEPDGVTVRQLAAHGRSWLPEAPLPVFSVSYGADADHVVTLDADHGWGLVRCAQEDGQTVVRFSQAQACPEAAVTWVLRAGPSGLETHLEVRGPAVRGAVFPRLTLAEPEGGGSAFVPHGQGRVERDAFRHNTRYRMPYAGPFAAMSFMGVHAESDAQPGLYLGWHDPEATRRDLMLDVLAHRRCAVLQATVPAEGMGRTSRWVTPTAALRATQGGWWGLVQEYRTFARTAPWWAARKPSHTWIDDTDWWLIASLDRSAADAGPAFVQGIVQAAQRVGVPPAVHAYNWHEIPFDNDYPHYLPARPAFAPALAELRRHGVHVTPYINGRLWDTRDRGLDDWQFTAVARPAAAKDERGDVVYEMYGSREADGSFTRLGVMCPSTELWQDKVADLVRRITGELGASGVYIDQVSAMAAVLCCDESHGHARGGGGWWRRGYGRMLEKTRQASNDAPLTTECNAEPYVGWLDAYLMWHCMFPGQVPAFSALYSSRVRLFGRAGIGGLENLRALTAQSWVFGEQIGWFSPSVVTDSGDAFAQLLTAAVRLRGLVRSVVQQGTMLRPPRLDSGPERPYAWGWDPRRTLLPPVLSSLWRHGEDTVLLAANHTEERAVVTWSFDAADHDYAGPVSMRRLGLDGQVTEERTLPAQGTVNWEMEPCTAAAWRLHPA